MLVNKATNIILEPQKQQSDKSLIHTCIATILPIHTCIATLKHINIQVIIKFILLILVIINLVKISE